jgi:hypothetical protein
LSPARAAIAGRAICQSPATGDKKLSKQGCEVAQYDGQNHRGCE